MKKLLTYLSVLGVGISALLIITAHASASSSFSPNDIIDDTVFDNVNTMNSPAVIDSFLNSFPSSCISPANGFTSPDPTGYSPSTGFTFGSNVSAGTVIYDAAQAYSINPQVLLATLQKEQSLVTGGAGCYPNTPNPSASFTCNLYGSPGETDNCTNACPYSGGCINIAVGYGCPSYCNANQEGFSAQIIRAAWKLKFNEQRSEGNVGWDVQKPGWNNSDDPTSCYYGPMTQGYRQQCSGGTNTYWDGYTTIGNSGSCAGLPSSVSVHMDTGATAALYYYTPNICGNLSFYNIFTNWFGPTTSLQNVLSMSVNTQPAANPARGQQVTYVVSITNTLSYPITVSALGIVGRAGDVNTGANIDMGWQGPITFSPGVAQQYTFTEILQNTGPLYFWPAILYSNTYSHYMNLMVTLNAHQPNLSIVTPLTISPSNPVAGQTVNLSATVKNNESQPIAISAIGIPIRYYNTYNYDVGWTASTPSIAAGATLTISGSIVFDKPGPYTSWVSWDLNNQFTTLSPIVTTNTLNATPNFGLSYVVTPDTTPALGEDVTIQFNLKNNLPVAMTLDAVGVVGRYDNPYTGSNRDFGWVGPETFTAGQQKTYTFTSNVTQLNNLYAWVAINYQGSYVHYNNWGFMLVPHKPNISITSPLTINSGSSVSAGQTVPVTVTVKNNEAYPIKYAAIGIPIRYYGVYNYDTAWVGPGTLSASGQSGDTLVLTGSVDFDKSGPYTAWPSLLIGNIYQTLGNQLNINVK